MTETWIEVAPSEVRVGDECKVDGIGANAADRALHFHGLDFYEVTRIFSNLLDVTKTGDGTVCFRRSSIVAARRRVEKVEETAKCGASTEPAGFNRVFCGKPAHHIGWHGRSNFEWPTEPPKPEPIKAGTWECFGAGAVYRVGNVWCHTSKHSSECRVYRAADPGKGWSSDQRKAERRVWRVSTEIIHSGAFYKLIDRRKATQDRRSK